jgi:hypothetical protein
MSVPTPPPEAQLIARKRAAKVPRLSRTQAALRAGISESRWRQIETGRIRLRGQDYPERAPDDTLALMAWVVGATPGELRGVGREDAATALETILASPPDPVDQLVKAVQGSREFTENQKRALIERLLGEG